MPITSHIDSGTGTRRHTATGDLTLESVRATLSEVYSRPEFRPDAAALWDLRGATGDFSTEDVRHLVDFITKLVGEGEQGKVAIVVPDHLANGMTNAYQAILAGQTRKPMRVFRNLEEAQGWLSESG
jgi:O-methyltransferase involved in polyketide biosynthesis